MNKTPLRIYELLLFHSQDPRLIQFQYSRASNQANLVATKGVTERKKKLGLSSDKRREMHQPFFDLKTNFESTFCSNLFFFCRLGDVFCIKEVPNVPSIYSTLTPPLVACLQSLYLRSKRTIRRRVQKPIVSLPTLIQPCRPRTPIHPSFIQIIDLKLGIRAYRFQSWISSYTEVFGAEPNSSSSQELVVQVRVTEER